MIGLRPHGCTFNLTVTCCLGPSTGVRLLPYALASSLAIVPWSVTFVYFGSLSRSLADVVDGHAGPDGLTAAALLTASGALLVAALAYTTVISRWCSIVLWF